MGERRAARSISPFEASIGFSRALRAGNHVFVSGTAPVWEDGSVDPDPEVQADRCLEIVVGALREVGAEPHHVVRVRMFLTDPAYGDAVSRAYSRVFGSVRPAATQLAVKALLDPRWKVEIEAEAIVD